MTTGRINQIVSKMANEICSYISKQYLE